MTQETYGGECLGGPADGAYLYSKYDTTRIPFPDYIAGTKNLTIYYNSDMRIKKNVHRYDYDAKQSKWIYVKE